VLKRNWNENGGRRKEKGEADFWDLEACTRDGQRRAPRKTLFCLERLLEKRRMDRKHRGGDGTRKNYRELQKSIAKQRSCPKELGEERGGEGGWERTRIEASSKNSLIGGSRRGSDGSFLGRDGRQIQLGRERKEGKETDQNLGHPQSSYESCRDPSCRERKTTDETSFEGKTKLQGR